MPLPSSGQISMGDINVELGRGRTTANTSLAGGTTPTAGSLFGLANSTVNKVAPHKISEFYGYTNLTYTQIFGWKYNPCSGDATIYEGSNGLYYTDTAGNLLNDIIYIYAGPDGDFDYFWSEIPYTDGVAGFANIISSFCGPS
jgi:hypothetical protein